MERLTERTEGWVAGLQLAALSLRGTADTDAFVEAFGSTDRYIFDYLTDETLAIQPADVRDFLESTCVLDRLSRRAVRRADRAGDGAAMLATLAQREPVPDPARRAAASGIATTGCSRTSSRPALDPARARRTSIAARRRWFAAHDLAVEAIRHYLAARGRRTGPRP